MIVSFLGSTIPTTGSLVHPLSMCVSSRSDFMPYNPIPHSHYPIRSDVSQNMDFGGCELDGEKSEFISDRPVDG